MKTSISALSPLLRSDALGFLMASLCLSPLKEFTLSELAARSGQSLASTMRDVDRLSTAGYLTERRVGRSRLIRFNTDHSMASHVSALFIHSHGPGAVIPKLAEEFLEGLQVYIFGSWAARLNNHEGPDPQDVDVLIIGETSMKKVSRFSEEASLLLNREVNPVVVSQDDWNNKSSGFLKTISNSPLFKAL